MTYQENPLSFKGKVIVGGASAALATASILYLRRSAKASTVSRIDIPVPDPGTITKIEPLFDIAKSQQLWTEWILRDTTYDVVTGQGKCAISEEELRQLLRLLTTLTWSAEKYIKDTGYVDAENRLADWKVRLAHYKAEFDRIYIGSLWRTPEQKCKEAYTRVVAPLMLGYWFDVLPGINYSSQERWRIKASDGKVPSNKKAPDFMTAFSFMNETSQYNRAMIEASRVFLEELKKRTGEVIAAGASGASWAAGKATEGLFDGLARGIGVDVKKLVTGVAIVGVLGVVVIVATSLPSGTSRPALPSE